MNLIVDFIAIAASPNLPKEGNTPNDGYNRFVDTNYSIVENDTQIKLSYGIDFWYSKDATNANMNVLMCIWDAASKQFMKSWLTGAEHLAWRKHNSPSEEDVYRLTLEKESLPNASKDKPFSFAVCLYLISDDWTKVYDKLFFGTFVYDGVKIKEIRPN